MLQYVTWEFGVYEKGSGMCDPTLFQTERKKELYEQCSCLALLERVWDRGNPGNLSHGKNE